MQELIDWYRTEEKALHAVTLAAMLHYKFVRIHPFDDGNGRIARLLLNYVLLKNNLPIITVKSTDKQNYLRVLHLADVGNNEPFIEYIAALVTWSLEVSIEAAKGENIEEPNDWEKELQLLKKKIGQKGDAKIESKYSMENVQAIYENLIEPLAEKWEIQLDKFDSLFYNRKCYVYITAKDSFTFNYQSTANTLEELKKLWKKISAEDKKSIGAIRIWCNCEKLRMPAKETKFQVGATKFSFHDNAYEMSFEDTIPTKSILYNESLSDEEMTNIVNIFSKNLMNSVYKATN
jgi:uncharacterized protein YejL (UPF0352 family)